MRSVSYFPYRLQVELSIRKKFPLIKVEAESLRFHNKEINLFI